MRKILIIMLVVLIAAAGGYIAYDMFLKKDTALEELVPSGALAYVRIKDLGRFLDQLETNELWKTVKEMDVSFLSSENSQAWASFKENIEKVKSNAVVRKIFGNDMALAVYTTPIDLVSLQSKSPQEALADIKGLLGNILLVGRVSKDVQAVEALSGLFAARAGFSKSSRDYQGHTIHTIRLNDPQLAIDYTLVGDALIMSLGPAFVEGSVDVARKSKGPLSEDEMFAKARLSMLDNASVYGYANLEAYYNALLDMLKQTTRLAQQQAGHNDDGPGQSGYRGFSEQDEANFKMLSGFKAAGFSSRKTDVREMKVDVFFEQAHMDPLVASFYTNCQSTDNPTISYVPQNALAYYWTACVDLKYYWDLMEREAASARNANPDFPPLMPDFTSMETALGLSIKDDLIPAIGDQVAVYLSDIKLDSLFPIPEFAVLIKLNNREVVEGVFQKFREQPFLMWRDETFQGQTISFPHIPMSNTINPGYAFLGDYLMIADEVRLIRETIGAFNEEGPGLKEDVAFQSVQEGFAGQNVTVQYINPRNLMNKVIDVIQWVQEWSQGEYDKQQAFKEGVKQRLRDIQSKYEQDLARQKENTNRIEYIKGRISELQPQGIDVSSQKSEIVTIENDVMVLNGALRDAQLQMQGLQDSLKPYERQTHDPREQERYLNNMVYPVLKSIGTVKAVGSRTWRSPGAFESKMIMSYE